MAGLRLEPGLVDLVVHDVTGEPGALPLLSHALLETWKRRRGTPSPRRTTARRWCARRDCPFGRRRVRRPRRPRSGTSRRSAPAPHRARRRRRGLAAATAHAEVADAEDRDEMANLIDALAAARLLTVDEESIEVAHEALIRQWPRLREWIDDSRAELRLERRSRGGRMSGIGSAVPMRSCSAVGALNPPGRAPPPAVGAGIPHGRAGGARSDAQAAARQSGACACCSRSRSYCCSSWPRPDLSPRSEQSRGPRELPTPASRPSLADVQRISAEAIATSETDLPLALSLVVEAFHLDDRYETRNALLTVLQRQPRCSDISACPPRLRHGRDRARRKDRCVRLGGRDRRVEPVHAG